MIIAIYKANVVAAAVSGRVGAFWGFAEPIDVPALFPSYGGSIFGCHAGVCVPATRPGGGILLAFLTGPRRRVVCADELNSGALRSRLR
jgi:hypothetical protein